MITYETQKVESEMLAHRKTCAAPNTHGKTPEKPRIYLRENDTYLVYQSNMI